MPNRPPLQIPLNALIGVIGYRGCGKSIIAQHIALQLIPGKSLVLIYDPEDCPEEPSIWRKWGYAFDDVGDLAEAFDKGIRVLRLCTSDNADAESLMVLARAIPHSLLIMDETSGVFHNDLQHCPEPFREIVSRGRRHGQGCILLGQSRLHLPEAFRNNAYVFSSNQAELSQVNWLEKRAKTKETELEEFAWWVLPPGPGTFKYRKLDRSELEAKRVSNSSLGKKPLAEMEVDDGRDATDDARAQEGGEDPEGGGESAGVHDSGQWAESR